MSGTPAAFGPVEVALYRRILISPGLTLPQLAESLDRPADELDKPAAMLTDLGLLRSEDGQRYTAVSPMLAEAASLGTEDLELAARRADLESRRHAIRSLVPEWNVALTAQTERAAIDVLDDPDEIQNIMMHYADQVRDEVLSIAPGRVPVERIGEHAMTANLYSLRRGVRTRALYQNSALGDRATVAYLSELAANGAHIRFIHAVPGRTVIVDREVALIRLPSKDSSRHSLVVVHEPNIVAWALATFEQLWSDASTLEEFLASHDHVLDIDATRRAILRLMADGEKDEAIARRLSISVRTCRRHIAEYMQQVGANSRFQAGVIAARSGHTEEPAPS